MAIGLAVPRATASCTDNGVSAVLNCVVMAQTAETAMEHGEGAFRGARLEVDEGLVGGASNASR